MKSIVVLYHANCPDGFSGAYAAWKKFGKKSLYLPVEPQTLPKIKIKNSEVFVIDASYSKKNIKKLLQNKNSVIVIDHHKSSQKEIKSASQWYFDLNHSASVLAWQYFHPNKKVPKLLSYIEDIDLWRFKLPYVKEIKSILELETQTFKNWEKLASDFEKQSHFKKYVEKGKIINEFEEKIIKKIMSYSSLVSFFGKKILMVNSPIFNSELGSLLAKKKPPLAIVWHQIGNKIKVSLRSTGKIDVSKIAKHFGGGGHKSAAGFTLLSTKNLPWKHIN